MCINFGVRYALCDASFANTAPKLQCHSMEHMVISRMLCGTKWRMVISVCFAFVQINEITTRLNVFIE